MKQKIVFFGNTQHSLIGLKVINKEIGIFHVVTIENSPIEKFAREENIPSTVTKTLDEQTVKNLEKLTPDFLVVEDYGLILPDSLLNIPKYAPLNIHHSLVPEYRGPSPVPSAILAGEKITGVSIIKMTAEVDAGDILAQTSYEMNGTETTDSLLIILNKLGAKLLVDVINNYDEFLKKTKKQTLPKTKFTDRMTRESGLIDLKNPPNPQILDRMIRAYYPWPTVWMKWKMENALRSSEPKDLRKKLKIVKLLPNKRIQVEGKRVMDYKNFVNGYQQQGEDLLKKLNLI